MQYVLLTNQFGGLNTYLTPSKVGPAGAVEATGVDTSEGSLQNRWDDTKPALSSGVWTDTDTYVPATSQTIVPWGVGALGMTGRYAVARFGGRLYRSHKGFGSFTTLRGIQYTSDTNTPPTWDFLGLFQPGEPAFAVASTGTGTGTKLNAGTYTYYCTFYNALGQESSPASASVTLSTSNYVSVTLPKAYTKCTTTGGSPTLTSLADIGRMRLGMRLTGSNIPANTYITAIDTTAGTVTLSANVNGSGTTTNVLIWDAQVVGTRVYRQGDGIDTPLLVAQTANLTTTTFTDNIANASLGEALTTIGTADIANNLRDISISPTGVLLCASDGNTVTYLSLVTPSIYDPAKVIQVADSPLTTIYALNRFICPTTRGAFTVTIDDAILGLPIVQTIDDTEPSQISYNVYAVDVGGAVWWNTNKGIVQTDGNTIETVTRYTINRDIAEYFCNCYGAEYYNGDFLAYLQAGPAVCRLFRYNRANGWSIISNLMSFSSPGALGFHINDGCIIYTGSTADSPAAVRRLEKGSTRLANGIYWTGEWVGAKQTALKKFRKVSAVFTGSVSIQPYVDGQSVGPPLTGTSAVVNKSERQSWWLPSGTKGRSVSLRVTLTSAGADVQELGVWVGEEREAMP